MAKKRAVPQVQGKLGISSPHGGFVPRVTLRAKRRRSKRTFVSPCFLVRCGCCAESVEITYGTDDNFVEINGVSAAREEWRKILLPLLED